MLSRYCILWYRGYWPDHAEIDRLSPFWRRQVGAVLGGR